MESLEHGVSREILAWWFDRFFVQELASEPDLVQGFWEEYFQSCEMSKPHDGMEIIQ